jgi:hypothetical protein
MATSIVPRFILLPLVFAGCDLLGQGSPPTPSGKANVTGTVPTSALIEQGRPTPHPLGLAGRSTVPTVAEWSQVGEVTVVGSSALNCETKAVREWVRVSCLDTSSSRGRPTGVTVTKGGGKGDTFVHSSGGIASLVFPFEEGREIAATFTWERESHNFTAFWPRGAPRPAARGTFDVKQAVSRPDPFAIECRSDAQCGTKRCCAGVGVHCTAACAGGSEGFPVCATDSECERKMPLFKGRVACKNSAEFAGLKTCQIR